MTEQLRELLEKQFPAGCVVVGKLPQGVDLFWRNEAGWEILELVKSLVEQYGDPAKVVTGCVEDRP